MKSSDDRQIYDGDGWPVLEGASDEDLRLAIAAAGGYAHYGNFLRACLAGIYAERDRTART